MRRRHWWTGRQLKRRLGGGVPGIEVGFIGADRVERHGSLTRWKMPSVCGGWRATVRCMSALRRASRNPAIAPSTGFERGRLSAAGTGIGVGPGFNEPVGFAVDLERVLAGVPRRGQPLEPRSPAPHARRVRGRWPRTPFQLPNAARRWVRDKGRRR